MKRIVYIVALMGVAACSSEVSNASPAAVSMPSATSTAVASKSAASARALVNVSLPDLTTNVGETVPTINLLAPGNLSQSLLSDLALQVSLVTWPEQTVVDTAQISAAALDEHTPSSIELRPKARLADRWYAVRVMSLPATMEFPRYAFSKKLDTGGFVWRFRTGAGPIVSSVELCEKGGRQTGAVMFSERIDPGAAPEALLTFDRRDCRYLPPQIVGTPDKANDPTTATIRFTCDTVGDLTVGWKAGAMAAGSSTIAVAVTSLSFTKNSESVGDSCRRLAGDI